VSDATLESAAVAAACAFERAEVSAAPAPFRPAFDFASARSAFAALLAFCAAFRPSLAFLSSLVGSK